MGTRCWLFIVVTLAVLCLAPSSWAQGGTSGSATTAGDQAEARWVFEGRVYEKRSSCCDNTSLSFGFNGPVNDKLDFSLLYSDVDGEARDGVSGSVVAFRRKVLSPMFSARLSRAGASPGLMLSLGADVAVADIATTNLDTGRAAIQDTFTPAAKLELRLGRPDATQWCVATQVALWDAQVRTSVNYPVPGFGTIWTVGGGASAALSRRVTIFADAQMPVGGDNYIDEVTSLPGSQTVWTVGGQYRFADRSETHIRVFGTNAMGPTLASSVVCMAESSSALSIALERRY